MANLVERIKDRLRALQAADPRLHPNTRASLYACWIAEQALGFPLPPLLKTLYIEVGSGGFGPGHGGIFGLPLAALSFGGHSVVEHYLGNLSDYEEGALAWPPGLLPICNWGCGITSSLDCSKPEIPVIRHDYNMDFEDIRPLLKPHQFFGDYGTLHDATWVEIGSFEEWLEAWIQGKDLFRLAYPAQSA